MTDYLIWAVLALYAVLVLVMAPRKVSASQFFGGGTADGRETSLVLLVASAAITWVFAKSIANAASLAGAFGVLGGLGYGIYYLSFFTAAAAIYFIRTRGGHTSIAGFLSSKYCPLCARLFLIAIAVRLINEVWSNTKVTALYFGPEGSGWYWTAAALVTAFTLFYSMRGGLRSSILTDGAQMLMAAVLLIVILATLGPGLVRHGLPEVGTSTAMAGLTFCGLALVQVLSYPFHDPVLTDRAFITSPTRMAKGLVLAGLVSGGFIVLFSIVGLYALRFGIGGSPVLGVPAALGLPMLLVFNAIMLTSAGSTLDSTFSSTSKLVARDWSTASAQPAPRDVSRGRWAMLTVGLLGNLPLLGIYFGDRLGPAIISATTISGTMVMGLAPIFLLSWIRAAGRLSFHLAFWPGLLLGILLVVEGSTGMTIFPSFIDLGAGKYADDLGVNVWGLGLCTLGYIAGSIRWKAR